MTLLVTDDGGAITAAVPVEDSVELPVGWTWTTLGEVAADMANGFGKRQQAAGTPHLVLRLADLRGGQISVDQARRINATPAEVRQYGMCPDDLLFVRVNGSADLVGRAARFYGCAETALYCDHFVRVRPALPEFAWTIQTYCESPAARWFVEQNKVSSAGQNTISQASLRALPIPLPPLAEQKRIAAKVEAVLAKTNVARQRLAKVPAILKRFRQSVLAAACSGRLTEDWREANPTVDPPATLMSRVIAARAARQQGAKTKAYPIPEEAESAASELPELPASWSAVRCLELCQPERALTYGVIKLGPHVTDGIPVLRSSDVRHLRIDAADMKCVSPKIASEFERTFLSGGEILVTVRGTLGGVAVAPPEMKGFNISREVALVPIEPEFSAEFFAIAIGSQNSQNWLAEVEKGVAYTGINIEDLKRLPLPLPPLPEQHEIVSRVSALFALADKAEARLAAATAGVERVTRAVLAKAFRGELVETEAALARREGRGYESAAQLLERVRAARAADGTASASKPRPRDAKARRSTPKPRSVAAPPH